MKQVGKVAPAIDEDYAAFAARDGGPAGRGNGNGKANGRRARKAAPSATTRRRKAGAHSS